LPFGLRSAPKIFTALADVAEWIAKQAGVKRLMHYLDDFLVVGATPELMRGDEMSIPCYVCLTGMVTSST